MLEGGLREGREFTTICSGSVGDVVTEANVGVTVLVSWCVCVCL